MALALAGDENDQPRGAKKLSTISRWCAIRQLCFPTATSWNSSFDNGIVKKRRQFLEHSLRLELTYYLVRFNMSDIVMSV